eukprot:1451650-Amphidinium_carterae.1
MNVELHLWTKRGSCGFPELQTHLHWVKHAGKDPIHGRSVGWLGRVRVREEELQSAASTITRAKKEQ